MIRFILRLFDLLSGPLRALGVDYPQFRAIVEAKLTLDGRRPMIMGARRHAKKEGNGFTGGLGLYALMGVVICFSLQSTGSPLVAMTLFHAFAMTMLGMSLVADFSSVLLDTTDNAILQPRPVTGRTMLAARIAHICVYLSLLTLSLSFATLLLGTYRWGAGFPPVFLFTLACSVILIVAAVNLFYLLAIRFTSGERLRDIIVYVQVFMSLSIFAGYQFLPRLIDMRTLRDLRIDHRPWIYLLPPAWMAAPVDLLAGNTGGPRRVLAAMSVVLPLLGLFAVTRYLGPRFNRALASMDTAPASNTGRLKRRAHRNRSRVQWLASLCCRAPAGRAAFEVVWTLCARDRQFKLRTYPSLAFVFLLPVIWITAGSPDLREALADLPTTRKHLLALYGACAMLPAVLIQLRFSENPQAAWIYAAMPIRSPGPILVGATKAMMVRFVLPTFIMVAAITLAVWGFSILDDVALAGSTTLLMCAVEGLLIGRCFPFSQGFAVSDASGRMSRSLLLLLIPAGLGGVHYILTFFPLLVPLAAPLVLALALLLFWVYARTPWSAVDMG